MFHAKSSEQSLSTLLISVDWNKCFFEWIINFTYTFNIYCYSGSLSFSLCHSDFHFFLYIFLPFPKLAVIQIAYVNAPPPSCFSPRHRQIQILFHFRLVYFSWGLVLWLFDWGVHTEPNETITGHCTQHSVLSLQRHSFKDLVKFSLCFAPWCVNPKSTSSDLFLLGSTLSALSILCVSGLAV